jgi:oxygen-independent coproporphyrinogen-3 oxidase
MEKAASLAEASRREVVQIHWGGGTPTFLPADDLAELAGLIRRIFAVSPDAEFGVEVDPREFSRAQLDALAAGGCNRISLGVQDLSPEVQKAVNRVQSPELTWTVLEAARARGIGSVNIDLIYGLPHQTAESFAATVAEVLAMSPDRLALFNFAYLPSLFRHQTTIDPAALPDPATKLRILEETIATLSCAGYVLIGMDHFAKPTDPLAQALRHRTLTRNFQGYSTCAESDLLAFGVSAISDVGGGYAQNDKAVASYGAALVEDRFATSRGLLMSAEDRLRREVIMRLMCHFRLDKDEIEGRFGLDFDRWFAQELAALEPLAEDGLVELSAHRIEVTPIGRLLVRNVAMTFDAYLGQSAVRYSRTV